MEKSLQKKVLKIAVYAAEIQMRSGAEIYRVEETIFHICNSVGMKEIEVFATSTGIFVSTAGSDENDSPVTLIRRVKGGGSDLNKISLVNTFSREFCAGLHPVDDCMGLLKEIDNVESYPMGVRLLGAALTGGFFALIFGGSMIDFCVALIAGIVCYSFSELLNKIDLNPFVKSFFCCGLAAFIAMLAYVSVIDASYEPIIIGTIMLFVPGAAITNSIRDFLSGDIVSGMARMSEAILTAIGLACGAGVVVKMFTMTGGIIIW